LFRHYATSDSLSLNYLLARPQDYGIEKPEPTFGDYGTEAFMEELAYAKEQLDRLDAFDYSALSYEQQLTYDLLRESLEESAASEEFLYYGDILSPTIGIQAQLPVLLAEYHVYEKGDFDDYLALLETLPAYFDAIIAFEREKKERGTFMAKGSAEDVVRQIEGFIENPDTNLLIGIFDERVDAFEGLTDAERADLKERNRVATLNAVVPAFRTLADSIAELNADNARTGGLPSLENGGAYYEFLVKESTGSPRSVDELESMVDAAIEASIDRINEIYQTNPSIYDEVSSPSYPASEPSAMLDYLKSAIVADFPALDDDGYELKYVDKSLEEFASPAFYLLPPIDDASHNVIYINGAQSSGDSLFSTLAHEGYPGHLYQTVYFRNLDRSPVRDILSYDGYVEGWAVYVERMSYRLAGLAEDAATVLAADTLATLCMYAKVDIGVNARGWGKDEIRDYLTQFGVSGDGVVDEIYDSMVAEPANYLKYTIGCLEILELKEAAREAWDADFSEQEFHEFLLETGPASFGVIGERLERRPASEKERAAA
jgi:uncharacterized protein (DUF885 family)